MTSIQIQKRTALLLVVILTYILLFYFLISMKMRLDFASFYSASIAYIDGINPYNVLIADYFAVPQKLPANLNPPFFLYIIQLLTRMNFPSAIGVWSFFSFILGLVGVGIVYLLAFSKDYFKKNWLYLFCIYLALYSTFMNLAIGQLGSLLLFFIMGGYYCYQNKHDCLAGICWGIITAIKLFPALLCLHALIKKRYLTAVIMIMTCLVAWLIPLLTYGVKTYSLYFDMLQRILWYGDNWNASIFGFFFRLFIDAQDRHQDLWLIKSALGVIFLLSLAWYSKKIKYISDELGSFCITLVMMLLLSPFGWMYYFSLIILPCIINWQTIQYSPSSKKANLWLISLFFMDFPIGYINSNSMGGMVSRITFHSWYFYGLLITLYLLCSSSFSASYKNLPQIEPRAPEPGARGGLAKPVYLLRPLLFILALGFFVPFIMLFGSQVINFFR